MNPEEAQNNFMKLDIFDITISGLSNHMKSRIIFQQEKWLQYQCKMNLSKKMIKKLTKRTSDSQNPLCVLNFYK